MNRKNKKVTVGGYKPGTDEKKIIKGVYDELDKMIEVKNESYREFNNRTLKDYLDDNDKRLNTHIQDKDAYDPPKEDWQANVALPTVRDKLKKILAGFSLQVPDMKFKAFGVKDNMMDVDRAEIAKWLVTGSYTQEQSPIIENFWESWEMAGKGTIVKYEGYLKTRYKRKFIKSYDIVTGKVEFDEKEVDVDDKCVSITVPLTELFIPDFYTYDIQDQTDLAWVKYVSEEIFEMEFGKYPNAKWVKTKGSNSNADTTTFYYQQRWGKRVEDKKVEVVKYYNRITDSYIIVANGVLLIDAPLLWTVNGKKVYPFAKSIWEPFVDQRCFYGNAFPNTMMGQYDIYNTLFNSVIDKEFRSIIQPTIIGAINRDAMELEDELVTGSTKIYVEDVSQIVPMKIQGVTNSDIKMIELIAGGLEETAPSLPSLMTSKNPTAREVVIAEEKIKETKVLYNEMIVELWRQKFSLRLANIQVNYPQPKEIIKDKKIEKIYKTYIIENAVLDEKTNERGILAIQFRNVRGKAKEKMKEEISVEEEVMKKQGIQYKKLIVPEDYLDSYEYQMEILAESFYKSSQAKAQAIVTEKLGIIAKLFPQMFIVNQEDYFEELMGAYDDKTAGKKMEKMNEYKEQKQSQQPQGAPQGGAAPDKNLIAK